MPDPAILGTEQTGTNGAPQQPGFFSRLGAGLKAILPYIGPIANHLAAAAGNYTPLELERQQREDDLHHQLAQSQMDTAGLTRRHLQQEVDNYETPAQQRAAQLSQAGQMEALKPPTHFPGVSEPGQQAGIYSQSFDPEAKQFKVNPLTVEKEVPNPALGTQNAQSAASQTPNYETGLGEFPQMDVSKTPPPPTLPATIKQRQQLLSPPAVGVTYSPSGLDTDVNSPTYGQTVQYVRDKGGNPVRTLLAPAGRGVLDTVAPMVTNAERSVQQPTGEITKENFTTTRQRLLPAQGGIQTGTGTGGHIGGGGVANTSPGNIGRGAVVGGKVPTAVTQAFSNVQDTRNRLQVMQQDLQRINENPNGNVGSMDMDLFSQHVALTFGTVKNARGGEALIEAHIKARSVPEEIGVIFNHLKNGGILSPEQRQNFIHLAQSRLQAYTDQYGNAQKESQAGFGMNPNAPQAMPAVPGASHGLTIKRDANGRIIGVE